MEHILQKIFIIVLLKGLINSEECIHRDYGNGGTVCVCNATYCDTAPGVEIPAAGQFVMYTSSKDGLRFNKTNGAFTEASFFSIYDIRVDRNKMNQKIVGWGGAFTDSATMNIKSLNEQTQDKLMRSYFLEDGIEYNFCRVPIGGTDFSTRAYTYDDVEGDVHLNHFELQYEDYEFKIPVIQEALRLRKNDLLLIASTWTAPPWMKTAHVFSGTSFLEKKYYQLWADYHIKFLDEYASNNIHFWGITTGNEPINGLTPFITINSMAWSPIDLSNWVADNLGPTMAKQYPDVAIITLDDQKIMLPWWAFLYYLNAKARSYTTGLAVHWYFNKITPSFMLTLTHITYPDQIILSTEASAGFGFANPHVALGSWERAEYYAKDIIECMQTWVSSWIDWNMALDTSGGPTYIDNYVDSPIIVNASAQEFYKQPTFFAMGHFSKFVPKDSVAMGTVNVNFFWGVSVTAFKRPDGATVVVLLNVDKDDYEVSIKDSTRGIMKMKIPNHSINTILYL